MPSTPPWAPYSSSIGTVIGPTQESSVSAFSKPTPITTLAATALTLFRPLEPGVKTVTFTNSGQRKALELILKADRDVVVVLPTGSGKTALALLPALLDDLLHPRLSVFVTPSLVLKEEMVDRCRKVGLPVVTYPPDTLRTAAGLIGVLIVSAEAIATPAFHQFIETATIARYVVDEAHVFVSQRHFRHPLASVVLLRRQPAALILMTATLPPLMLPALEKLFDIEVEPSNIVRLPTTRQNVLLDLVHAGSTAPAPKERRALETRKKEDFQAAKQVLSSLLRLFLQKTAARNSQVIIFCKTRDEVQDLGSYLRSELDKKAIGTYFSPSMRAQTQHRLGRDLGISSSASDLSGDLEAIENLERFKSLDGQMRLLVTTTALLQAMDNPVSQSRLA
jgi:superfamily II DNA helicase RecQ